MISPAMVVDSTVVSPSVSTEIASEGTPRAIKYERPTAPSVNTASPPAPPVVIIRGAILATYSSTAWSRRARKTGDGRPWYSAAPSTRMISADCASSRVDWRSIRTEKYAMKRIIAANPVNSAFQTVLLTCATTIVVAMAKSETSATETFHLLEEALRGDWPQTPYYACGFDRDAGCYPGIYSETPEPIPTGSRTLTRVADMFRANAHSNYSSGDLLHSRQAQHNLELPGGLERTGVAEDIFESL